MTAQEWLQITTQVPSLWPTQPWQGPTIKAGWELCKDLPVGLVRRAVDDLSREGLKFCPPPGVVFARARLLEQEKPALPASDALRDATPDERSLAVSRAEDLRLWREEGKGPIAEVGAAWGVFEGHLKGALCRECAVVYRLVMDPPIGRNGRVDFAPIHNSACADGRPLLERWWAGVQNAVETAHDHAVGRAS